MKKNARISQHLRAVQAGEVKIFDPGLELVKPIIRAVAILVILSACGWIDLGFQSESGKVVIRTLLPTLTPTSVLIPQTVVTTNPEIVAALPTPSPTPTTAEIVLSVAATPLPEPTATAPVVPELLVEATAEPVEIIVVASTNTPASDPAANTNPAPQPVNTPFVLPTITPIPETSGWSFANLRTYSDEYEGGVLLYGDLINDTGAPQEVAFITGTFFDDQGRVIANQENTSEYWPVEVIPSGGHAPFELAVNGIQTLSNYKLWVNSQAANYSPRQDFSFAEVQQWGEEDAYCLTGQVENPSGLQEYLIIAAVLYDGQGNVVNFSDDFKSDPAELDSDEGVDFEICIAPPNQNVARYDLRAWGQ